MRYNITGNFTKIAETSGTIQNISNVYPVEVSDKAEAGSGILLYPLNMFSFKAPAIYMRCTDASGWAECRVVTFINGNTSTDSTETNEDDNVDQMLDDILNTSSNYTPNSEVDPIIDEMWNSGDADTDDNFDDALDDIFGF